MPVVNHNRSSSSVSSGIGSSTTRVRILYGFLVAASAIFVIRAFYLQVIKHDYYATAALSTQLKEYQIPAERGVLYAQNGSERTPLVLNETLYTLFADPTFIEDSEDVAFKLSEIIDTDASTINNLLKTPETRYVVIAKRLSKEQRQQVEELNIAGVGTREASYRTYPQGSLASQTLGFVNADGEGQYGLEQALNEELSGTPGELRAITDSQGVPLVSNPDNVINDPKNGESMSLTIDIGMQKQVEDLLKTGLKRAKSESGSVVVMDPTNGHIKAMANYPTYDPSKLSEVKDIATLANPSISSALEVGSIMKTLTAASALNEDVISLSTSYYNPGVVRVGDREITDVLDGSGTENLEGILTLSLNTGAVWLLQQLGRDATINDRARMTWHSYMTKHFFLGSTTGIEQAGESAGYVPPPEDNGQGIDVTYANTSFGQAFTATPIQMAAAFSSIVNGGTYYQPTLIDSVRKDGDWVKKDAVVRKEQVVDEATSADMRSVLQKVVGHAWYGLHHDSYNIGGKTGTAQIARPAEEGGGYYEDKYNGTYLGFIGGDRPEYVIMVVVNEPKIGGFAGSSAAAPVFKDVGEMIINNFGVTPRS